MFMTVKVHNVMIFINVCVAYECFLCNETLLATRVVGVCFRKCVKASGIRAHVCYDLILIGFDRMGVDRIRV